MIGEFLAWLTALGEQYPWLAPASAIVTIATAAVVTVLWLRERIIGKAYRIRREVEEKSERLEADVGALRSEVKNLRERLPEAAWEVAERERLDGNEELAVRVLRRHMDIEGARLSEMARQIAHFDLGLVTERDRDRHLIPAERFALLAFHLDPRNGEAGQLLKEIQQLRGDAFEHVQFTDEMAMSAHDPNGYYGLSQAPDAVASRVRGADKAIDRGRYRHALALAESAFLAARQWPLANREPVALFARHFRAKALKHLGRYGEALREIDGRDGRPGVLSLEEQSPDLGPMHSGTLGSRHLRASVLRDVGRYEEALREIDGSPNRSGFLSSEEQSPDLGPSHQSTLNSRGLRASVLADLGRCEEALREIDGGADRLSVVALAERNPDLGRRALGTLNSRQLRASILKDLGRSEEALREIDGGKNRPGVLSLQEESPHLGPRHPNTLYSRQLRASILQGLGRSEEALREIDGGKDRPGVLSLQEESPDLGPKHPSTLYSRWLRASVLEDLGRYEEALREIDGGKDRPGVLSLEEESPDLGPRHPNTLYIRQLRALVLRGLSRHEEALREIDGGKDRPGVLSLQQESPDMGPRHPRTLAARSLAGRFFAISDTMRKANESFDRWVWRKKRCLDLCTPAR